MNEIIDDESKNRFELNLGEHLAFVTYAKSLKTITYFHTEVPPEFEGQGVGKKLAVRVLEFARENDLKVNALCPFIAAYVKRHPDQYKDLLSDKSRQNIFGE